MFEIGFSELIVVAIVALLVVGPERLPSLVRTMLIYVRKIKAGFNSIRDEVEKELELDELKNSMQSTDLKKVIGYDELQESLRDLQKESQTMLDVAKDGYEYADNTVKEAINEAKKSVDVNIDKDISASIDNVAEPAIAHSHDNHLSKFSGDEESDTPIETVKNTNDK